MIRDQSLMISRAAKWRVVASMSFGLLVFCATIARGGVVHGNGFLEQIIEPDREAKGFGAEVVLDGDIAAIGAPRADSGTGVVVIFNVREKRQILRLSPVTGSKKDRVAAFGNAIAISGRRIIVGAPGYKDKTGRVRGAVFVFDLTTGEQVALVKGPGGKESVISRFGDTVDAAGDRVVVGAAGTGAFLVDLPSMGFVTRLTPKPQGEFSEIGGDVSISDKWVAATGTKEGDQSGGAVFIYEAERGEFIKKYEAPEDFESASEVFKAVIAVSDTGLLVGVPSARNNISTDGAFVFDLGGNGEGRKLVPEDEAPLAIGSAVALSGDFVILGSSGVQSVMNGGYIATPRCYAYSLSEGKRVATLFWPEVPTRNMPKLMRVRGGIGKSVAVASVKPGKARILVGSSDIFGQREGLQAAYLFTVRTNGGW